ncbi:MAG: apaH [Gammaproteobacteria bacterium]|jgi:bis(5'-nucleosyl)-tetraphosphatase (symmetrical)|nr:apaH [Gammaproteobacteria bacterium]
MTPYTYAIGDIQGCFDELQDLLALIGFRSEIDHLWFVGDLVSRGPQSLEVLRFIKDLPHATVVLGNHDIHLLAIASGRLPFREREKETSLQSIIDAPDRDGLLNWIRKQPLLHHDPSLGYVMAHAGILPEWSLEEAKACAAELEAVLRGDDYTAAFPHLYGDTPNVWSSTLTGWDRLRFITNAFTRMRFYDPKGHLDFQCNGEPNTAPPGYLPWYEQPHRKAQDISILFGHWAALDGHTSIANVYALDTGCVWGRRLTCMRLEDTQRFSVRARVTKLSA